MNKVIDAEQLLLRLYAIRDYYGTKTAQQRAGRGGVVACICAVKEIPKIDAEPIRHGQWECGGICSECGLDNEERKTDYCPNCGARMDGE